MNWKTFSSDEMLALRSNPYTLKVTEKTITFTAAFKEAFFEQLCVGGSPSSIIEDFGYSIEVLGSTRICGIAQHIREEAESGEGFHSGRRKAVSMANADEISSMSYSRAMIKLQNEINYLKNEMEFLKKIMQADKQAVRKK